MKKVSILSILLLILSIPIFAQNLSGDVWFVPVTSHVMRGTGFTTEVHVNSGSQYFSAYGFDIAFNQTIITPNTAIGSSSVSPGADGFVSAVNATTPGLLLITGFDAIGTGPGTDLHVITVNWNADNIGNTTLGITVRDFADPNGNTIGNPNGIAGSIIVTDSVYTLGDVNEDGSINIADALIVAQYYVSLNPPQFTAPIEAGDCDGSGITNIIDAMLIARYYVGLITEFPGSTVTPTPEATPDVTPIPGEETQIMLNGNSISVNGSGATVNGTNVTITAAGYYTINGTLNDGRIIVDTLDELLVTLTLNGINIYSSVNSPLSVSNAPGGTEVVLAENTQNYITDSSSYVFDDPQTDEPNAALFSKDDMDIMGLGSLIVDANYNDGISCKDDMNISDCTITVTAVDDGIRGKNSLEIKSGTTITVNSGGDCLKSDDAEDALIEIKKCNLDLTSTGGDGMESELALTITHLESNVNITTTGPGGDISTKGIKGVGSVVIENGIITVDSTDDAIHSNNSVAIWGGTFNISTNDDGIHGEYVLDVNGGDINITQCYEGLEAEVVTINNGTIRLYADDDGINAADAETNTGHPGNPGAYYIYINGGYIVVHITDITIPGSTGGDGIDCNGYIEMSGGTVLVHGNSNNMDSAVDYDGSFTMRGGFIMGVGTSRMAMAPGGTNSTQNALLYNFNAQNDLLNIQTSSGNSIVTFMPDKQYQSIAFSSPDLVTGTSYNVYFGGSASGSVTDGLYQAGTTYYPGTLGTSFTVQSTVTRIGGGSIWP